jgi:hypothetical protein
MLCVKVGVAEGMGQDRAAIEEKLRRQELGVGLLLLPVCCCA